MRDVEIYIGGQAIPLEDDGVEIEVFDESGSTLTGEITVAEMVRRVQLHGELVRALGSAIGVAIDCQQRWSRGHPEIVDGVRAVLAKVKP